MKRKIFVLLLAAALLFGLGAMTNARAAEPEMTVSQQFLDLGLQGLMVIKVAEIYIGIHCDGAVCLHHMGRRTVRHGDPLLRQKDCIQRIGITGAEDELGVQPGSFRVAGDPLHQGGFSAAGAAFEDVEPASTDGIG